MGTHVDMSHVAATPVGLHVVVEVDVIAVARHKVRFKVICRDEAGLIGEGFHERAIIDRDPFMARVATKRSPAKTNEPDGFALGSRGELQRERRRY